MLKIFIIWYDYNGTYVEDFISVTDAENRLVELAQICVDKSQGAVVEEVIKGRAVSYEPCEIVAGVKIDAIL